VFILDFRGVVNKFLNEGLAIEISEEVSKVYELAAITKELEEKYVLIFKNIKGSSIRVVSGIYGSRERLAKALGLSVREFIDRYSKAVDSPEPVEEVPWGPVHENFTDRVDLDILPIPKIYEKDAGEYLTASIVIAKDPETGIYNASYHRMLKIRKNKLAVRVVPRDLWHYLRKAREQGKKLEAAVVIGVDPATAIAASTTTSIYQDELEIASAILEDGLKVVKGKKIDVLYPANAEIVLEGYFDPEETHEEGPFVDITGSYDKVRNEPVFTVTGIGYRNNPMFHFILSAGKEHITLMGFPREVKIMKHVSSVAAIVDVHLSEAGCGWFEGIISMRKRHKDEPIDAGLAAFGAHPSMKRVIIVDPDINIFDYNEVNWAVLTRANPVTDYIIIPRSKGSSLDKSGDPRSKIIIDATIKGSEEQFERGKIPLSDKAKEIIKRYKAESDL